MDKYYLINGNLAKETIFNLLYNINTSGFVWRGFTNKEKQMLPSAAFYGQPENGSLDVFKKTDIPQRVFIPGELDRIGHYINNRNKLGEYPFEIPDELSAIVFPHTQSETSFLENLQMKYFPKSNLLLQAASYVQHYFSGTSLLDFSVNPLKALYFAIGKDDTLGNDSWLFGMPISWFQIHKKELSFDFYLPSYYKNTRIQNQEGIFIYQLFDVERMSKGESCNYANILDLVENSFDGDHSYGLYDKMDLKDIKERSKTSCFNGFNETIGISYVLLKVPKEEKPYLKFYLNSIGIDDNFMMNAIK